MTSLLITHRQELARLGLIVDGISYGTPWSVGAYGGVLRDFELRLVRRDEDFSPKLTTFLTSRIGLSNSEIAEIKESSICRDKHIC